MALLHKLVLKYREEIKQLKAQLNDGDDARHTRLARSSSTADLSSPTPSRLPVKRPPARTPSPAHMHHLSADMAIHRPIPKRSSPLLRGVSPDMTLLQLQAGEEQRALKTAYENLEHEYDQAEDALRKYRMRRSAPHSPNIQPVDPVPALDLSKLDEHSSFVRTVEPVIEEYEKAISGTESALVETRQVLDGKNLQIDALQNRLMFAQRVEMSSMEALADLRAKVMQMEAMLDLKAQVTDKEDKEKVEEKDKELDNLKLQLTQLRHENDQLVQAQTLARLLLLLVSLILPFGIAWYHDLLLILFT
jgi:hypothetical protein